MLKLQVSFCKTTNKLEFKVSSCCSLVFVWIKCPISLSSQRRADGPLRFRYKKQFVRVRKTEWFGLKYQFWLRQKHLTHTHTLSLSPASARTSESPTFSRLLPPGGAPSSQQTHCVSQNERVNLKPAHKISFDNFFGCVSERTFQTLKQI